MIAAQIPAPMPAQHPGHPSPAAQDFPRPRSVRRPIDPDTFELQAGGRWERVLTHLCQGVWTPAELVNLTGPHAYTRKVERTRIRRALDTMRALGLVLCVPGFGWTATPDGQARLERLLADANHRVAA